MQILILFLSYLVCTLVALTPFALSGTISREEDADEIRKNNLMESEKKL